MGTAGTDAAIDVAQVALMQDDWRVVRRRFASAGVPSGRSSNRQGIAAWRHYGGGRTI
jgi:hypothetical protein